MFYMLSEMIFKNLKCNFYFFREIIIIFIYSDDSDWNMTVKGSTSTPYIEQLNDNEPTLDNLRIEVVQQNNVNNGDFQDRLVSPVKETRRSPSKEQKSTVPLVKNEVTNQRRSTSPQKDSPSRSLAHTGGVAKSDLNLVSAHY